MLVDTAGNSGSSRSSVAFVIAPTLAPQLDTEDDMSNGISDGTLRVWFAYRNGNDDDAPAAPTGVIDFGRVGYLDFVNKELVTFDLSSILAAADHHMSPEPILWTHAVVVDPRGHVWISAEHSNALIEIDLSRHVSGERIRTLNLRQGTVISIVSQTKWRIRAE